MSENPTDSDDRDAPSPTDDELAAREPDPPVTVTRGPGDRADDVEEVDSE
jgi:hypothetical protein